MSAYRQTIDETIDTIGRRATYYRNLVVAVVLLGLVSLGVVLFGQALGLLACLLLVFPLCGAFYYLDARLLARWHARLLDRWVEGGIDFVALNEAFRATSTLPKPTLSAMLGSLPALGTLQAEQALATNRRAVVAAAVKAIHACRADALAFKTGGATVIVGAVVLAVMLRTWWPLSLLAGVALIPLLVDRSREFRLRMAIAEALSAYGASGIGQAQFEGLVRGLDWQPLSPSARDRFIGAASGSGPRD